jgi:hypothetical protein
MLAAVLLLTLAVQQPAQQPASAAKPKAHTAQVADTNKTKSKSHHSSSTKEKSKPATSSTASHDTTKAKP